MKLLPLSPTTFHIMLSVAQDPAYSALIASRVAYDTFGELDLRPATLHDNLSRLERHGWLRRTNSERPGSGCSYVLTEEGRVVLENDLYRWRIVTSRATDALRRAP